MRLRFFIAIAAALFSLPVQAESLKCDNLPHLFDAYFANHYFYKGMSAEIRNRVVAQFIKRVDPSKSLLLESDVAKLSADVANVFSTQETGNCAILGEASQLAIQRAKEDETYARAVLGPEYKLEESTEIILDPDKRSYPRSIEEKRVFLKKMIHFQISSYLLIGIKLPEAKKQLIHRYELVVRRLSERQMQQMIEAYAEAFASSLDPHSSFLSKENLEDFQIQMQLSLEGIGASLTSQDGFTVLEELMPGGGAEKSKMLQPKDKIIAVAQGDGKPTSVIDMDLRDVVKLIRGKKGTKVRLTILRDAAGGTQTLDVSIIRDKIDIKEQAAKIFYETRKAGSRTFKLGVIHLPSFYGSEGGARSSYQDIKNLLKEANAEKVDGVLLDLSKNGGGLLQDVVKISGLFIKRGPIVATKDSRNRLEVLSDSDDDVQYTGPLVVVTSRLSASASEILAGALKDYKRAVVAGGDHTFGKGSVQILTGLPFDLGAIKVTTGMFFLPGGESTQHKGVSSDILMPSIFNTKEIGEMALEYSLPSQAIQSFISKEANSAEPKKHWESLDTGVIQKLVNKSRERVAKSQQFAEIRKEIEDIERNKGLIKLAEVKKRSEAEKKKEQKNKAKAGDRKRKEIDNPLVQEGINVLADLVALRTPE
jgi:carboxyl-terminal processing protease